MRTDQIIASLFLSNLYIGVSRLAIKIAANVMLENHGTGNTCTGNDLTSIPPGISFNISSLRIRRRRRWQIACFRDAAGHQPVIDYISALTNLDDLELIFHVVQRLSRVGLDLIDTKMAKHIDGPLFELRKDRHRILFARDTDRNRFVLLSTFYKDTQKTPWDEIDRAHEYWHDYLSSGRCEIYAVPFDEF